MADDFIWQSKVLGTDEKSVLSDKKCVAEFALDGDKTAIARVADMELKPVFKINTSQSDNEQEPS